MSANKRKSSPSSLGSDLTREDAHRITAVEYEELPELTDEMLARARVRKGGRPHAADPRKPVSIRLPESVLARWRASGRGWQTRIAQLVASHAP